MRGNGLQFFRGELPVAVFVKFFDHGGGVGFLAGFHFFHAFGSFRMVLKPFFLHSLSFLLGKLAVPILVKFLQDGGFLGFLGLLDVGLQNGYFLVGKLSVLVGIVFGQYQFFSDNHDTGIDSLHLNSFWPLAVSASGMVAMTSPSFRGGLHFRSIGRSLRSGRRRSVLSERGTCGESRGDNHLLGHIFEW